MKPVAVYELLVSGEVVYIGCTQNPHRRCYAHRAYRALAAWPEIRVVSWHRTRAAALKVEARLIRKHKPPLNTQHAGRKYREHPTRRPDLKRLRDIWLSNPGLTNHEVLALMPPGWTAADARGLFGSRHAATT